MFFRGPQRRVLVGGVVAAHSPQVLFEQWMPGGIERQPIRSQGWLNAVVVASKPRPGQQAINKRKDARASDERFGVAADLPRKRHKDPMDLGLLFFK